MRFNQRQFQILTLTILIAAFVTICLLNRQVSEEIDRVLPDLNQITGDGEIQSPGQQPPKAEAEPKILANLEDIAKASTSLFPLQHQIRDGCEWITSELEEYLVLHYKEPLISALDIKGVQQVLTELQFYDGTVDGIYGPKTLLAVKRFQQYYGIDSTGIMDLNDYNLLATVYEETIPAVKKAKPVGNVQLLIILDERTLYVLEDSIVYHKFPIAIGTPDTPSPLGNWKIVAKDTWGEGFGGRWLGLNVPYGRFGIHGTDKPWSIGSAESHGCFRMFNRDVDLLSGWVTWGTQVHVVGGDFPYNLPWRTMDDGDRGSDVWQLQSRLKELGYYKWRPDGVYGWGTRSAVKKFQSEHKLPETGKVEWSTRQELGLYHFQ